MPKAAEGTSGSAGSAPSRHASDHASNTDCASSSDSRLKPGSGEILAPAFPLVHAADARRSRRVFKPPFHAAPRPRPSLSASGKPARDALWVPFVFAEVRLAFFVKRVAPFLTLFGHVEQHGGVPPAPADPPEPSQSALRAALRQRSAIGLFCSISRHQRTVSFSRSAIGTTVFNQAHIQRFLSVVLTAQEPDFHGLFSARRCAPCTRRPTAVEGSHLRTGLAEDGIFCVDGQSHIMCST